MKIGHEFNERYILGVKGSKGKKGTEETILQENKLKFKLLISKTRKG